MGCTAILFFSPGRSSLEGKRKWEPASQKARPEEKTGMRRPYIGGNTCSKHMRGWQASEELRALRKKDAERQRNKRTRDAQQELEAGQACTG